MAEMTGTVDPAVLDEVIRRVVEVAQPEKIILFGSAAWGRMGPHSDLDPLVVRARGRRPRSDGRHLSEPSRRRDGSRCHRGISRRPGALP